MRLPKGHINDGSSVGGGSTGSTGGSTETFNFFVAPSTRGTNPGSDANNGTSSLTPFATILKGMQAASAALGGIGQSVGVEDGVYDEFLNDPASVSGNSWTDKVRIASRDASTSVWMRPTSTGQHVMYFATTQQFIEFDAINMDGFGSSGSLNGWGIIATQFGDGSAAQKIRWKNCEMKNARPADNLDTNGGSMVSLRYSTTLGQGGGGFEFSSCRLHDAGSTGSFSYGFYIHCPDVLVEHCDISSVSGHGIQLYNSGANTASSAVLRWNYIHDVTKTSDHNFTGIIAFDAHRDVRIIGNLIARIGGVVPSTSVENSNGVIIHACSSVRFENNTITGVSSGTGVSIDSGATGETRNNLVWNNATNWTDAVGLSSATNLIGVNPGTINSTNFHLTSTSAARNTGSQSTLSSTDVNRDLDNNSRPLGGVTDVGCYEFVE